MDKKASVLFVSLMVLLAMLAFTNPPIATADLQAAQLTSNISFTGNDLDPFGVLWAGDKNFTLWKSIDNGSTFQRAYELPHASLSTSYPNPYYGTVWTVYVDSRGYLFVSGGGASNALLRSTNGGLNFAQVAYGDDSSNRTFYIAMTEDGLGNLYAVTYTVGFATPVMLKSVNGGLTWSRIGSFSVFHFHNIKYNPFNGYLYAVTGERSTNLDRCNDSEKIFRSKDGGASWRLVIDRIDSLGTVYLPIAFNGSWVYVGQDYPNRICQIHRFYDDGGNLTFQPQVVYTPNASDGYMPFVSGVFFNNTLIFANSAESQNGTSRILTSADGLNWTTLYAQNMSSVDVRWNLFTIHPKNALFTTIKTGYSYQIKDVPPPPPPSPQPTETPIETPYTTPSPNPTTQPVTVSNTPTATPITKLKATPTPSPTPPQSTVTPNSNVTKQITATETPSQVGAPIKIDLYTQLAVVATVVGGAALLPVMLKKRHSRNH